MIYVIGDTHFNHHNIIRYCNRPFSNVDQMNETIISNWNSVVTNYDTIIHVGDLGFKMRDYDNEILKSLFGYKILIMGNHDRSSVSMYMKIGFNEVYKKKSFYMDDFIFSHRPIKSDSIIYNKINIHGHVHNNLWFRYDYSHFNVSCDVINYKPISLDVIKDISKTDKLIKEYNCYDRS